MSSCVSRFDKDHVSMKQWTEAFAKLYSEPDKMRRPEEFWNSVMAHLSSVGEAIRRTNYLEVVQESAYAFCWMCGLVAKCFELESDPVFRIDNCLSDIVALKFPDRCGHCREVHCCCDAKFVDKKKDKAGKYRELHESWKNYVTVWPDRSFNGWLNEFSNIFGARIHIQTLESIGFHMLEEAGEEAKSVRQLVQFRGLAHSKEHGVDDDFLGKLNNIDELVCAYTKYSKVAKEALGGKRSFKEVMDNNPKEILTSDKDDIIKTRLVFAKMDFVIEIADTFSWLCAVLLKLMEIINDLELNEDVRKKFNIEEQLRKSFSQLDGENIVCDGKLRKLKCYVCGREQCECRFFHLEN